MVVEATTQSDLLQRMISSSAAKVTTGYLAVKAMTTSEAAHTRTRSGGGGGGKDWLKGGQGDDKLGENPGRDILQGEQRADRFKLAAGRVAAGRDLITDYNLSRGYKLIFSEDLKLTTTETGNIILADKSNEIHATL